jgi:hypothetical protein
VSAAKKFRVRGKAPQSWRDPSAKRMLALFDTAIAEGRSFKLEFDGQRMTLEIGPRLPQIVHVRTKRTKRVSRKDGAK